MHLTDSASTYAGFGGRRNDRRWLLLLLNDIPSILKITVMRIVFMGTPEFAVPTLLKLHQSDHEVVAVITATDKMGGRGGKKLLVSDVKKAAMELGLPVLQPKNLKSPTFQAELASYQADVQVVVAFRMLPVAVWDMPPEGTYNLHGSLLPAYRGAAPIHRAVMNGETETGVTTFKLQHAIDTGSIAKQARLAIGPDDTTGDVYHQLKEIGATLMLETMDALAGGQLILTAQDNSKVSHAPKIFSADCEINPRKTGQEVHNHVRGLQPFPTAWISIGNEAYKIIRTKVLETSSLHPGQWASDNKTYLHLGCMKQDVSILEIKAPGKRSMPIKDYLNGSDLAEWPIDLQGID